MRRRSLIPDKTMNTKIRDDFPILQRTIAGRPLIYFDSAATALKPRCVIDKEREYSTQYSANVHRGRHRLSEEASDAYEDARASIAHHLNVSSSSVIFVRNATEAINLVATGLRSSEIGRVAVSIAEHHSNLLPWMRDFSVIWLDQRPDDPLDLPTLSDVLRREKPFLVAFSAVSNITGVANPIKEICALSRDHGVLTCVDASQAVPHVRLDVSDLGCDYLAFSGHKICGPTGIGVLTGGRQALERLRPLRRESARAFGSPTGRPFYSHNPQT
jgi:cysteine desulfurase/selenocysteine lyase